jgi:hypothetical protein
VQALEPLWGAIKPFCQPQKFDTTSSWQNAEGGSHGVEVAAH